MIAETPGAGELSLQGRVDGELFDRAYDAAGRWQVLSTAGDPRSALSASQVAFLESLGSVFAHVGGEYADHFAARGIEVSVARPDFYVFGTAASLDELGRARRRPRGAPARARHRLTHVRGERSCVDSSPCWRLG